ncbi:hypothetical protein [Neorhizobium galegae]|uniref:hypothetical protein n=1 Tax=Neorhizobium galegae TaxID=399 RepID=UPI0006279235|nr:hypothetical protein [Neorhizobium galegae]KAB1126302.1 hypothetical protein F4V90_04085 [Neorhizobium galegae]MCQ1805273.1 hypothetical protein [Neorhizobium galegae]
MKHISAWDQHKIDQETRLYARELARVEARQARIEMDAELRRRCAVQPYFSPLQKKSKSIREKLWALLD